MNRMRVVKRGDFNRFYVYAFDINSDRNVCLCSINELLLMMQAALE